MDDELNPLEICIQMSNFNKMLSCLQNSLTHINESLIIHDRDFGRTITKNRLWAEQMERDIKEIEDILNKFKPFYE